MVRRQRGESPSLAVGVNGHAKRHYSRNDPSMSRQTTSRVAWLMLALVLFTGCHPTQPFYFQSDGDLSHYVDKATEMEYPDVHTESAAGHDREPGTDDRVEPGFQGDLGPDTGRVHLHRIAEFKGPKN